MTKRKFKISVLSSLSALCISGAGIAAFASEPVITVNNSTVSSVSVSTSSLDTSDMFTARDMEVGYDEEESITITLSGDSVSCDSAAVSIEGSVVTITDEGTYILSGTLDDGMIIVDAENTDKIQLVLDGVDITSSTSAAIYVLQADKVFITTTAGSENTLSNGGEYVAIDDNNIDAVIFSKDDLTLNGEGSLTINAAAGHGVVSKDDLVVTSGTYYITAEGHGLSGKDSLRIANGNFTIDSGNDALHADNDEDSELGYLYIADGNFTISAADDGIHASYAVVIDGGVIDITESYEGIEGLSIDINGGEISLVASDDGLNAAGGNDSSGMGGFGGFNDIFAVTDGAYITISGGTLYVNASGDGIDSNGNLYVTGGATYVSGPTNSANGSLDYNGTAYISGGVFIAAGASGMAQNFSSSDQGVIMVNTNTQSAGTAITLTDADGNELLNWSPDKEYSNIIVSAPELTEDSTYTLTAGSSSSEITLDSLIYGSSGGFGGMGGFGGRGNMQGGNMQGSNRQGGHGNMPGGNLPDDFNGEMPEGFDGEMPEGFDGEMPEGFNGEMPKNNGGL